MKKYIVILGIILLVAGIAGAAYYGFAARRLVYGSYGIAAIGVIIAALGALMKTSAVGTAMKTEFKCAKCGATFSSQAALDQHSKDKHGP